MEIARRIDTVTARRVVFSLCLTISSAVALPAWGDPISSFECTVAQATSPEGSKCIDWGLKEYGNDAPKYHTLFCKGSGLTCCLRETTKPYTISDCKYLADVPPVPPPPPSCKSIDENFHKAVEAQKRTQQALKDITDKEQKINATKDRKLIDAWKNEVKAEMNDHDKAVKEVQKLSPAWDKCHKDLFNTRK